MLEICECVAFEYSNAKTLLLQQDDIVVALLVPQLICINTKTNLEPCLNWYGIDTVFLVALHDHNLSQQISPSRDVYHAIVCNLYRGLT